MKLRAVALPFVLVALWLATATACQGTFTGGSGGGVGALLVNGSAQPSLSFTGFTSGGSNPPQSVSVSQPGNTQTNGVTVDTTACTNIASTDFAALTVPSSLTITPRGAGSCAIVLTSALTGTQATIYVTVSAAGPTPTPAPTPGVLTVSPTSLAFTAPSSSAQTLTVSESNYTGTFALNGGGTSGLYCGNPVVATANDAAIGGPTGTRTITPSSSGSCTYVVTDDHGGSVSVPVTVGSATPTSSPSPTPVPTSPSGLAVSSVSEMWGGNVAGQGYNTSGAAQIAHNSGDTNWMPDSSILVTWNQTLNGGAGLPIPPSPYPSTPPAGYFAFQITGTPPPGNTTSPAIEDSGICYAKGGACAGGATYGGQHWINTSYYHYPNTAVELDFQHKTPCEMYTITVYGPQTSPYSFQFQTVGAGATPCPGSTASPQPAPTPCVGGMWQQGAWATPAPCGTPDTAADLPAGLPTPIPFMVLEHMFSSSLDDMHCTGTPLSPPETCTMGADSQQQVNYLGQIGMGAAKLSFQSDQMWQGCGQGQQYGGPNGQMPGHSYTAPDFTCYTTITNALHAAGVEVVPAIIQYQGAKYYTYGGSSVPLSRGEFYQNLCSQTATWANTSFPTIKEFEIFNEPNSPGWSNFPLQAYVVSGGQAGQNTVTIQLQNGTAIPNANSTDPFAPHAPNGKEIAFYDGTNNAVTENLSVTSTVTSLGNGEYTFTLPAGTTFAYSHAPNTMVSLDSDVSGYTAGKYALMCYQALKAVNPNFLAMGPSMGGIHNPFGILGEMETAGCQTGKCWDVLSGHGGNWMCTCSPYASNAGGEMIQYMQDMFAQLKTSGDPAWNTVLYDDSEWACCGTSAQSGVGEDMAFQGWEAANGINSIFSQGGRGVGVGYLSICYQCDPSGFSGGGYCASSAFATALIGSNFGTNDQYKPADVVEHGIMPSCSSGDGTLAGQTKKPGWYTLNQFFCSGFGGAPSCTGTAIADIAPKARLAAYREMIAYRKRGMYDESAKIAGMLLQASGLALR